MDFWRLIITVGIGFVLIVLLNLADKYIVKAPEPRANFTGIWEEKPGLYLNGRQFTCMRGIDTPRVDYLDEPVSEFERKDKAAPREYIH